MTIKVIPIVPKEGMIRIIANDLYRMEDIQEAAIQCGYDPEKLYDKLSGFPNEKNKVIGELIYAND
jgi:hypothetical protein